MSEAEQGEIVHDVAELESLLSNPSDAAVEALSRVSGDIMLLGVAGKIGPTLARMTRRGSQNAGVDRRIIGVSRFSTADTDRDLNAHDVETIQGDLLDPEFIARLPDVPNIIYLVGMKFGAAEDQARTWAVNTYLPSLICNRFRSSRIVALSTGNIYGYVPTGGQGSRETDEPNPVGEYAMSCVGRERIFEYFSRTLGIPVALIRLNYASELRYGVLVDLAQQVHAGNDIDVSMGYVNVIWQGDANAMILCALADTDSPPFYLNVASPEILGIRQVCEQLASLMGKNVCFTGTESPDALLANTEKGLGMYGQPKVNADQMTRWVAHWIGNGGPTLGKPTHFEARNGKF